MKFKELGRTGEKIPAIGIGTWNLSLNITKEVEALQYGIKLGMKLIDTAEIYGTEEIVGIAIKSFPREEVFVATKVSPNHFRYKDVIKSCNSSLERLGIKQIDLYQLHWPNPRIPIEETMRAMEKLVEEGKIRYIGVSNFSVEELIKAQEALKNNEIVSNQVEYSLLNRDIEKDLMKFCEKEKITLIAYSPFALGKMFENKKLMDFLEKIAKKYNRNPAQIALNWLISKRQVVAIPKASNLKHLEENSQASDFNMDKKDLKDIDNFSRNFKKKSLKDSLKLFTKIWR